MPRSDLSNARRRNIPAQDGELDEGEKEPPAGGFLTTVGTNVSVSGILHERRKTPPGHATNSLSLSPSSLIHTCLKRTKRTLAERSEDATAFRRGW